MTEFSGEAGRMSNNQFPQETDDELSLTDPSDDDTTADDLAASEAAGERPDAKGSDNNG